MELTQNPRAGAAILSLATGTRSLENAVLSAGDLPAGAVLGQLTAGGAYVALAPAATNGSEKAAGILHTGADATGASVAIVVIARDAEVKVDALVWPAGITTPQRAAAVAELIARGIILR